MTRILTLFCGLAIVLLTSGCTSGNAETTRQSRSGPITAEQIQEAQIISDAYEVIRRLRPAWLQQRRHSSSLTRATPDPIPVYVDGVIQYGRTEAALRSISAIQIRAIVRLTPAQAQMRFGMGHPAGAFVVDLR